MGRLITPIVDQFNSNVRSVYDLAEFDVLVLDYAITSIAQLNKRLIKLKIDNPAMLATGTLTQLGNIRQNESLQTKYSQIFNQCVVLLVSYFASAISDMFEESVTIHLTRSPPPGILKEELRLELGELFDINFDLSSNLGQILAKKKDISFQDMQSIHRAFEHYLGLNLERDKSVNTIIYGQACRHSIVHDGSVVNARLINQISKAEPRLISHEMSEGGTLLFSPEEIRILGDTMLEYTTRLASLLIDVLEDPE
jgi:hypothetical protein